MSELDWRQFSAVAYDFDGTIADSLNVHTRARLEAFRIYARKHQDRRYIDIPTEIHKQAHYHGHHSVEIIAWILKEAGITPEIDHEAAQPIRDIKSELYQQEASEGLPPTDGALEFISRGGVIWPDYQGIVTSGYKDREVMPFVYKHGLKDIFSDERIITADDFLESNGEIDWSRQKPAPDQYNLLIERLAVEPVELLVFEDNSRGIKAAKAAGAFVIGLATTHAPWEIKEFSEDSRPNVIAADFYRASEMLGLSA